MVSVWTCFSFDWILLLLVGCGGVDFDIVLFEKCDYVGGIFGGASVHAYFVNSMAVGVVKIDDMADGFDESVSGFILGHNSVAKTGAEIFENKPAGKTSD